MKAVIYRQYGTPAVLEVGDIPARPASSSEVLVRVIAGSVNPVDWKTTEGQLAAYAPISFPAVAGSDLAGLVVDAHPDTGFREGDHVLGSVAPFVGAFSQYVPVPAAVLTKKPDDLSFEHAAALPTAGLTALTAVRAVDTSDAVVIINGAAGGVGSFAVQLAKSAGAQVIGICSPRSVEYVRSLGAEPIPYGSGLIERLPAVDRTRTRLIDTHGGALQLLVGPVITPEHSVSVANPEIETLGGRYLVVTPTATDLAELADQATGGNITVHVSHRFSIGDASTAYETLQRGGVDGKIVLDATSWP